MMARSFLSLLMAALAGNVQALAPLPLAGATATACLQLPPMLGRHPPRRATKPVPDAAWCAQHLDSLTISSETREAFVPGAPVHMLQAPWSAATCATTIAAAESYAQWQTGRHHLYPTTDMSAADLPDGKGEATLRLAQEVILPALAAAFGTPVTGLHFKDMFLAKYTPTGQPGLGNHTDGSAYSFNMLLSDPMTDFIGGGTRFAAPVDGVVSPRRGEVLLHKGSLLHAGCPVTQGSRYVLVGFVNRDDETTEDTVTPRETKTSELLRFTVESFPLGMVIEVDEGDAVSCAMVVEVERNGAADKAGVQRGDCLRGLFLGTNDDFVSLDGQTFEQVIDLLSNQKKAAVHFVAERWCRPTVNDTP
jgi:hypothetical protein